MKLATFRINDEQDKVGALMKDGTMLDLAHAGLLMQESRSTCFDSMLALIESGEAGLALAQRLLDAAPEAAGIATSTYCLRAPLPLPSQMRDFVAFEQHMLTAGRQIGKLLEQLAGPPAPLQPPPIPPVWYRQPIYYKCNRYAVTGSGEINWPATSSVIDYELELACVIGKAGRDISSKNAESHIFGYTVFNDLTARDLQIKEMQGPFGPCKGKDFDRANVLGPVIVTVDEIGSLPSLAMTAKVNGELWSSGNSGTMYWSFAQIIEHVSRCETLHPGEILGSGTVGGGCGLELGRFLKHEDVVVLEIEGIGRIETRINAPHVTTRRVL